jgi:glycosyltransferase involved in cell wall biosynthesis
MKNPQVWYLGLTATVLIIATFLIFYDSNMDYVIQINKEKQIQIQYDLWSYYNKEKVNKPTHAKSRSVMLLHAYVPFWNAGSEVCAHTVNRLLVQKGHEVWVGAPGYPYRVYEGVHLFDSNNRLLLHSIMRYAHTLGTHSFRDRCLKLSEMYGVAFIDWFHGGTYTGNVRDAEKPDTYTNIWSVFNSTSLMTAHKNVNEEKMHILRPPVDWHEYEVQPRLHQRKYVTLSNLNENKGGHILIDIAKAAPEIEFLGVRGSYWKQIEDKSVPNLTYIDNTPKIKEVYAVTKILIMPSEAETWGRTAVEAMSSGIPVVASPTPGLKECCEDAALFVTRTNIDEWVRIIRRLANDQSFYNEYANRGRARAKQLEPTHDLEMFLEWYEKKVVPSTDHSKGNPPTFLEKILDPL